MPDDSKMAELVRKKMDAMSSKTKDSEGPMAIAVRMAADFKGLPDEDKRSFLSEVGKMFPLPPSVMDGLPFKLEYIKDGE